MPVLRLVLACAALLLAPAPALADVISDGHVDVGPRFVDGRFTLQVYDDPTWRPIDDVVLQVRDEAILAVPDDPAYGFLKQKPGTELFVIPQTQNPDVVWLGWNTQDPEVMETIDRGVTMTIAGVQGPGTLDVYLQSGDFAEPQVLTPKPIWIDVNTHTHANWVFSEPGVYLVQVKLEADLVDGTTVSDTQELRFAVGSGTSTEQALAASWKGKPAAAPTATAAAVDEGDGGVPAGAVIGLAGTALLAGFAIVVARGRGAKRKARA